MNLAPENDGPFINESIAQALTNAAFLIQ